MALAYGELVIPRPTGVAHDDTKALLVSSFGKFQAVCAEKLAQERLNRHQSSRVCRHKYGGVNQAMMRTLRGQEVFAEFAIKAGDSYIVQSRAMLAEVNVRWSHYYDKPQLEPTPWWIPKIEAKHLSATIAHMHTAICPVVVNAWLRHYDTCRFGWHYRGKIAHDSTFQLRTGIAQGCSLSVLAFQGFQAMQLPLVLRLNAMFPSVRICVCADHVTLWCADRLVLEQALAELLAYFIYRSVGIDLSDQKS
eukprot:6477756-Amphidinium_carterae.1